MADVGPFVVAFPDARAFVHIRTRTDTTKRPRRPPRCEGAPGAVSVMLN